MTKKRETPFVECGTAFINVEEDKPAKSKPARTERDEITVAKSIFDEIVEFTETEETPKQQRAKKGGKVRAAKLTPQRRSEIARKAAQKRWQKPSY